VLNSEYKIIHLNKIKEKSKIFNEIPILYLAAGPSLDENIDWIKKNQDKFFIVTIGAAYKKLLANNIKIDVITTVDESDILGKLQFDDESVSKISKETIILASVMTNQNVLKKFNQENLFLFEIFTPFQMDNNVFDGFSIGEITLAILLNFNPKQIYLIGLDLALNQKTGESHAKASNSLIQVIDLNKEQKRDTFIIDESLLKVKGNFEEEVFTTPLFYSSIKSAEGKISKKSEDTIIYNLSTHGAFFEGAIPQKIEEIEIKNFNSFKSKDIRFTNLLEETSFTELSPESKKEFRREILFLNGEAKDILNSIKNKDFENYDEFFDEIFVFAKKVSENRCPIFYQILANYFQMVVPYLSYHFNDLKV
ncbi:MAG: motility associated factor glycosyltransferase family protein, partial [Arcobacter sp.]|nr:motility associated factor glycosyltransferase family protein [Arcobacter sp.]